MEIDKFVGPNPTLKTALTSNVGDLLSHSDKTNENNNNRSSLKKILINNHTIQTNKGKIGGHLALEGFLDL